MLGRLTSRKFHSLQMSINVNVDMDSVESFLEFVIARNVEEIKLSAFPFWNSTFSPIITFPFSSPSLIALELDVFYSLNSLGVGSSSLPNLKTLKLRIYGKDAQGICMLIKSCPLLEVLKLGYYYEYDYYTGDAILIDISCPNLKSLDIFNSTGEQQNKIMINAPNLLYLEIDDYLVRYHFVVTPTRLVEASIWLQDNEFLVGDNMISNIFPASCNVTYLAIKGTMVLGYLKSMQDNGAMPIFHNLLKLVISAGTPQSGLWNALMLLLQRFPNLEELEVQWIDGFCPTMPLYYNHLGTPAHVLSKGKRVKISGIEWSDNYMVMLKSILSHATVLEQLVVQYVRNYTRRFPDQLWVEYEFSEALLKLPKTSSMCEIVFCGSYIQNASSNTLKN